MALLTKLKFNDTQDEYLVVGFRCRYTRQYNRYRPTSCPACEQMEITVVAPTTDDFLFYEWFVNQNALSGKLCYELPVTSQNAYPEVRTIGFSDATCLSVNEHYDVSRQNRRLLTMVIIPQEITINDINVQHL